MRKRILTLAIVFAVLVALVVPASLAMATPTGTVVCTVTGSLVSVSVSDGSVAYGVLAAGATEDTTTTGLGDVQTATNNGTVDADLTIKSSNASPPVIWTLGAAAGADTFTHKASLDDGASWTIAMTVPDGYVALSSGVAPSGTVDFDLQIGMPTTITDPSPKTIIVTVLAVESP